MTDLDIRRPSPHVAEVWLNRPDVRNAFNDGVIAALTETFARLNQESDLRVVLLAGHGKAFCAGADLNWMRAMADYSWEENRADAQKLADMLWTLDQCPVPVVGRVHGDCYAGGMGLAAVCDVLLASDNVTFCLSEARLGLLPATIGPYVVRAMGEQASRRYFTTAERFSAAQAQAMGFVHELCTPEELDARVAGDRVGPGGQRPGRGARLQAPGARRGGPPSRWHAARRDRAPHRRHPRQRRRPGGRAVLPEQAQAELAGRLNCKPPRDRAVEPLWHSIVQWLHTVGIHLDDRVAGSIAAAGTQASEAMDLPSLVALAAALGWASGFRLYAVVFLVGAAGQAGWMTAAAGPAGAAAPGDADRQRRLAVASSSLPTRFRAWIRCGTCCKA